MASNAPRLPEQYQVASVADPAERFEVSELLSEAAGAHSPFGDIDFPIPSSALTYTHPTAADRPNLADGR